MGQNLVLNMDDHGYRVAVYNRTTEKVDEFLAGPAAGTSVIGARSLEELVAALERPARDADGQGRRGGRRHDRAAPPPPRAGRRRHRRRQLELRGLDPPGARAARGGLLFVGTGISGGEEERATARRSCPAARRRAWPHVKEIFQAIAAKVDDGTPCCDWVGEDGAGHYVKMVHNGIEYGDMQVIAEAYHLLRAGARPLVRRAARRLRRVERRASSTPT